MWFKLPNNVNFLLTELSGAQSLQIPWASARTIREMEKCGGQLFPCLLLVLKDIKDLSSSQTSSCGTIDIFLQRFLYHLLSPHLRIIFPIIFNDPLRNYLFYVGDRTSSIHHTRLWLNLSAINHGLFKINCAVSSLCNSVMLRLKILNTSVFAL